MNWSKVGKIVQVILTYIAIRLLGLEIARRSWNKLGYHRLGYWKAFRLVTVWTYLWDVAGEYWLAGQRRHKRQLEDLTKAGLTL